MSNFPCTQCGVCCRHVNFSELTAYLDRGDGVCRHHDLNTHLCTIYEHRPAVCRVDIFYEQYFKKQYTWDEFIELNLIACKQLSELDKNE
ncbi:TPA: YkgJ family cysteine cluster protein [Acinetobacter baumannii]|uniref:YkgJ family cysteine cluster protein n=1 Tax=Acinetobacter TaxID=469 RepID=UPI000DE6515E|nr:MULTISPECIES: YkgJ family cysteine cluster protein [Acinetobacter]EKU8015416.1 YkgJ family cysteine cluster protein [Acinetobacter baumannii]EKV2799455.1 YkgJ family cysteine cluster protein [Acinetobacter baumannii]EME4727852.1 YkgJ family cysteine cluster protein [Acinetobacter baumannii]MBE4722382.1 YkgJ family cysteine cluster protein [Acinetobacter baumannii]MBR8565406.1 zinc/iron-chelating domain-containing protein [Acinetobacter baumannii]